MYSQNELNISINLNKVQIKVVILPHSKFGENLISFHFLFWENEIHIQTNLFFVFYKFHGGLINRFILHTKCIHFTDYLEIYDILILYYHVFRILNFQFRLIMAEYLYYHSTGQFRYQLYGKCCTDFIFQIKRSQTHQKLTF